MNSNFNFQSFLFISPKKIIISINDEFTFEELYKKENTIKNDTNEISFIISKFSKPLFLKEINSPFSARFKNRNITLIKIINGNI